MEDSSNRPSSPSSEIDQEPKLPWQTPAVTEFQVSEVTVASGVGQGLDGGQYS